MDTYEMHPSKEVVDAIIGKIAHRFIFRCNMNAKIYKKYGHSEQKSDWDKNKV